MSGFTTESFLQKLAKRKRELEAQDEEQRRKRRPDGTLKRYYEAPSLKALSLVELLEHFADKLSTIHEGF